MEKFKVTVIYASDDVKSAYQEWYFGSDINKKEKWLEDHEDFLIHREFNTEAEAEAYIQAIDDLSDMVETIVLKGE